MGGGREGGREGGEIGGRREEGGREGGREGEKRKCKRQQLIVSLADIHTQFIATSTSLLMYMYTAC